MTKKHFTKALCFLLSFCMIFSGIAFAVPTVETVEPTAEESVSTESTQTALAAKGYAPGLNMLNQTTSPWDFESESVAAYTTVLGTWTSAGSNVSVVDNTTKDAVNSSSKALLLAVKATGDVYPSVSFSTPITMSAKRPVYVTGKYRKSYTPLASETHTGEGCLWLMKNGYIAADIGIEMNKGWKQFAKTVDFSKSRNASTGKTDSSDYSSISFQTKALKADGTTDFYFDDILFMPYYKATYHLNDGSETTLKDDYFLFDDDGNMLTTYTPDLTVAPTTNRYGYIFKGWATSASATTVLSEGATITLANADIDLYAVWERDPDLPEPTEYHWNFEDVSTRVWRANNTGYSLTYKNGMAIVNTNAETYKGTPYISHPGVSLDTKAHRYLVFNARSKDSVSSIKFYFTTSTHTQASEAQTMTVKLDTHASTFKEYVIDMSKNENWTGNYKSCMLQFTSGSGIVEIEDIYFTTLYETSEEETAKEYHYPMSAISAWGHTSKTDNEDGTITLVRDANKGNQGAIYVAKPEQTLDASEYSKLVIKAKDDSGISGFGIYYCTSGRGITEEFSQTMCMNTTLSTATSGDYRYYVLDLAGANGWAGNILRFMISPLRAGSITVGDVYLTNTLDNLTAEYHYPMSAVSGWGHTSITDNEDGTVTLVRDANKGNEGAADLAKPDKTLSASMYTKLVIKTKDAAGISGFSVYYSTSERGITAEFSSTMCINAKLSPITSGDYRYYTVDLAGANGWKGNILRFMIAPAGAGSITISDIFLTNNLDALSEAEDTSTVVEKLAFYSDANTITEDHGTITLAPYIRYTDGHEESDFSSVQYITDSVCAQVKKNADGSATVTAQKNGTVNITIILPDGITMLSKSITITNQAERIAANSFKVLMFGNSIRGHSYAESIGWYGNGYGMAASSEDKDYAHRFIYYMNKKYGDGVASLTPHGTPAGFEAAAAAAKTYNADDFKTYVDGFLSFVKKYSPDIITIQLGENGGEAQSSTVYASVMAQVIKAMQAEAPDAVIVISTPFWSSKDSNKVVGTYAAAKECGIRVAPVNTLGNTAWSAANKNMAFDAPWITDATSNGVKAHPGDVGMDNIAKMFFEQVNITLSANEKTEYTTVPQSVNITSASGEAKITEAYGTLQLTSAITPSDAAQGVKWSVSNKDIASVDANGLVSALNNGTVKVRATSKYINTVYGEIEIEVSGQTTPYTVTYDKNTTDEVTGMPAPNSLAKKNFVFDAVYPVRKTYRFLGWSLKADGTEADVITGADIEKDTTVYAIWEKAYRWTFDRDGFKEEFTVENGFNEYVINGYFTTIATGTDKDAGVILKIKSPEIDINPSDYHALTLRMKSSEAVSTSTVEMTIKTTNGNKVFTKTIPNNEYYTYEFILSELTGKITGFEFKPTDVDTTIYIDNISFETTPILRYDENAGSDTVTGIPSSIYDLADDKVALSTDIPKRTGYTFLGWARRADSKLLIDEETVSVKKGDVFYAVWDKNDHWEFDNDSENSVSNVDATKTTYTDGVLHYETSSSTDPIVGNKKALGYTTTSTSDVIEVKMKWTANVNMTTQIFYQTSDGPELSEGHSARTNLNSYGMTVTDWKKVRVNFAGASGWSGKLNSLRFDLTSNLGTVDVDYIRFTNSEANIVTNSDETRKVMDDWGTYIVRKGGTLAPQGVTELKNLYLTGDIDMTAGVIKVTDTVEIAEDAPYAVFTFDMTTAGGTGADYMYLAGYEKPLAPANGKYVVKLDNGVGFVNIGSVSDVTKRVLYKVTKTGATKLDESFAAIDSAVSIRTSAPAGARFRAMASLSLLNASVETDGFAVKEYGFLVSTEMKLDNISKLTLDAVESGKAVKGVAHDETTHIIYDMTDEQLIYTAVLVGLPATATAYQTKLYVRPYTILSNGTVIYGNPLSESMYDIALRICDASTGNEEYFDYVSGIVDLVESK